MGSEPQRLDDRLFQTGTTHIEVKCWACGHSVTLRPSDLPDGITDYDFEKRATCKCGAGWPYVTKFPKKAPMTMWETCWNWRDHSSELDHSFAVHDQA